MSFLELQNLSLRFDARMALEGLSLAVHQGEFFSLLGPSGCGKTTTIRLIAGFLHPNSGRILLQERDITSLPPEKRNMGIVFQSYALFPHLNVIENVAFGLKARKVPEREIGVKVRRALELVDLPGYEFRPIFELSGGEQQRVAIARAIVIEPLVLLLDEPLSNLDASLREATRRQLRRLAKSLGITTLFVTHDQEEAFALSDRIALLWKGQVQQVGTPQQLYHHPFNEFVAQFIGKSNILSLPCKAVASGFVTFSMPSGKELVAFLRPGIEFKPAVTFKVLLRPEALQFESSGNMARLGTGKIVGQQFTGRISEYEVDCSGLRLTVSEASQSPNRLHPVGEEVQLYYSPETVHVLQ
jgi:iron(III) transport system ATP-binding protein